MIFADLPAGADVFLDANTLVYHFGAHPVFQAVCRELVEKIENSHFQGFISAHVLSDMAHKLMVAEAMTRFGWPGQGIAPRVRRHPAQVQQLHRYRQAIDELPLMRIKVLDVDRRLVSLAADVSGQYGLLSGDALIVATMREHGLTHLASNDADFDCVPDIIRYAPA